MKLEILKKGRFSGLCLTYTNLSSLDWVRLRAGYQPPHWRRGGTRWDEGYQTTVRINLEGEPGPMLYLTLSSRAISWTG